MALLESLVVALADVGLSLNAGKTVILTNEAQPPNHLKTQQGDVIQVKVDGSGHKWLGCILTAGHKGRISSDLRFHLQAASRAFFAHKGTLCDRKVPVRHRLKFFDAVVTPVAMFACGHRTIRQADLQHMDVLFRKLLRVLVGPPGYLDWSQCWHEILHEWNIKVETLVAEHGVKLWSHRCLEMHWKLGGYVSSLPFHRWVQRVLHWNPDGKRVTGAPRRTWTSKFEDYCRYRHLGDWRVLASNKDEWLQRTHDFVSFAANHVD